MADVKWIKIVTDIFDDDKILLIESMPEADSIIVIWFKLLCLAGKQNNSGVFLLNGRIPFTDEMFSTIFRRPLNTVRLALNTFEQFGMIEIINDTVTIPKWEKHQQLDALEASREATRARVKRYREKQKELTDGCNVTVTSSNADRIDKNREDKKREEVNKTFAKPTVQEITGYINENNYPVDAEYFFDYYESNGWMVGKHHMKDWKASVRTWARNQRPSVAEKPAAPVDEKPAPPPYTDRSNWWNGMTFQQFMDGRRFFQRDGKWYRLTPDGYTEERGADFAPTCDFVRERTIQYDKPLNPKPLLQD